MSEVIALLAAVEKHRHNANAKAQHLESVRKRLSPRVLALNPEAVRELAQATAEHQIAESSISGAEQLCREGAASCVRYGYALEKRKRAICRENLAIIRDGITKRVGRFFIPERLELVLVNATAAIREDVAENSGPCAKGDPTTSELHPQVQPADVIAAIVALEGAIADAEMRQAELKKEFN